VADSEMLLAPAALLLEARQLVVPAYKTRSSFPDNSGSIPGLDRHPTIAGKQAAVQDQGAASQAALRRFARSGGG
jgi:hypothetical protein